MAAPAGDGRRERGRFGRGEYVLANGGNALPYLRTMANTANDGYMIPEQVWDQADPTSFGHVFGKGTGSAAPLAWAMGSTSGWRKASTRDVPSRPRQWSPGDTPPDRFRTCPT
jgi:hypothetical protein